MDIFNKELVIVIYALNFFYKNFEPIAVKNYNIPMKIIKNTAK